MTSLVTASHLPLLRAQLTPNQWSPEQIAGSLRRHKLLSISHETIYKHVRRDKARGGSIFRCLRHARKRFRKRYVHNENNNGIIRQYLPKRTTMRHISQQHCDNIAKALNTRPRKRYDYRSPTEVLREL